MAVPVTPVRPPSLPYVAEVRVRGSEVDVYALGSHRDLASAQSRCQGDFRTLGPLAWQATRAGVWAAHPSTNVTYIIRRR